MKPKIFLAFTCIGACCQAQEMEKGSRLKMLSGILQRMQEFKGKNGLEQ